MRKKSLTQKKFRECIRECIPELTNNPTIHEKLLQAAFENSDTKYLLSRAKEELLKAEMFISSPLEYDTIIKAIQFLLMYMIKANEATKN